MTTDELQAFFEEHDDAYMKGGDIRPDRRLHRRPDLNAFLLLDRLVPGHRDMVAGAAHDEIFLDVDLGALAAVASEDDLLDLIRCGVRVGEYDSLCMFA